MPLWAVMCCSAQPAVIARSRTTRVVTGTVPSARVVRAQRKRGTPGRSAPVEYYHVVFTLPAPVSEIAYTNKSVIYSLLFRTAAETLQMIAADPRHLGARIGLTLVLHTWGSALTHHPHVHGIVPGGGLSLDGERWVNCRRGFFLSVRVLSRLFRRRFSEGLTQAHRQGQLQFFGDNAGLADPTAFAMGWHRCGRSTGWSMPNARLPVLMPSCATCPAIPIGWPSQTDVSLLWTNRVSPFAGRTTAPRAGPRSRR